MGVLYARVPPGAGGAWVPITGLPTDLSLYVRKTGDTMTGQLTINRGPSQLQLALVGDNSYQGWYSDDGNSRRGYIQGSSTGLYIRSEAGPAVMEGPGVELVANGSNNVKLRVGAQENFVCTPTQNTSGVVLNAVALHTWGQVPGSAPYGLTVDNGSIRTGDMVDSTKPMTNWTDCGLRVFQQSVAGGIAIHAPGMAPILGAANSLGERLRCLNNPNTGYIPIAASAFETNSTITSKRDVRPLRDRERVIVHHPIDADVAPQPDVMALRPIAYRPVIPAMRIAPTEGEYETVNPFDDATWRSEPCDPDSVFGREGLRERLGLIAEEVQHVIPSAVSHDIDGNAIGIDYAQVTVALLDHVQRMTDEISTLRYRVAELEGTP